MCTKQCCCHRFCCCCLEPWTPQMLLIWLLWFSLPSADHTCGCCCCLEPWTPQLLLIWLLLTTPAVVVVYTVHTATVATLPLINSFSNQQQFIIDLKYYIYFKFKIRKYDLIVSWDFWRIFFFKQTITVMLISILKMCRVIFRFRVDIRSKKIKICISLKTWIRLTRITDRLFFKEMACRINLVVWLT